MSLQSTPNSATAAKAGLSPNKLRENLLHARALEAVLWGMPAVNFELMYQALKQAGGASNQVVYWSRLLDWKNQTLTPNPNVIYVYPFLDTKDAGPVVLEIPPAGAEGSFTGSIDDAWQTAIEDVGPAGYDKGKGGKYLILPPGYKEQTPDTYLSFAADTYRSYVILRSNLNSGGDADIAKALVYGKRIKLYPLSQAANPPPTSFVDAIDTVFDSTIPYDLRFFEALDRFVQHEPWLTRDMAMIDVLRSIGIEKGKPFKPDARTKAILNQAIQEAHVLMDDEYEKIFESSFAPGARWTLPARPALMEGLQTDFAKPDSYPRDDRGVTYSMAYFSAKHIGAGQFYLMAIQDKAGDALHGAQTYRLRVPAKPPVRLYWSATLYDRATHALIRDLPYSSRASNTPGLQTNTDGTVDLYFGPKAPAGKESNWVPTNPNGGFEALFRFYGPDKALFDKTWVLPDIEKLG